MHPSGRMLLALYGNGMLRLWNLLDGRCINKRKLGLSEEEKLLAEEEGKEDKDKKDEEDKDEEDKDESDIDDDENESEKEPKKENIIDKFQNRPE